MAPVLYIRTSAILFLSLLILSLQGCASWHHAISQPERTQGLIAPAPQGEHELVTLQGPGLFVSAQLTKQGGTNDLTFVILDIDGRNVVNFSIAAANNVGLTQNNPYGLVLVKSKGDIKTLTIGFNSPLRFARELKLRVQVNEPTVVQIVANVIHGRS